MIGFTNLLCGTSNESVRLNHQPIVVWNITNRCNLKCKHCYIEADDIDYKDELTTNEGKELIDDLAELQVPVLLFSGGEPLIRKDIFELGYYANLKGIRSVISSNGTLINKQIARDIKQAGFQYVGISIDGLEETHDNFRGIKGSFNKSLEGLKILRKEGIKTGIRFTINRFNYKELKDLLDLAIRERVPRFCMYHLVYSGRGRDMMNEDTSSDEKREYITYLISKIIELGKLNVGLEILTADNHVDGVYIYQYITETRPEKGNEILRILRSYGGCSAGDKIASIDATGNVHPCQFWGHKTLGNIRERKFSEIWDDNGFLLKLRNKSIYLKGKCGECKYKEICGGCRVRAEAIYKDIWAPDPACYIFI
ncbi:MAG: radical SAM protein [bacterium]|nr:radical SAM protein [bacterium]